MLVACGGKSEPSTVDLNRAFTLFDAEGRRAGTVFLRPLGDGEMRDVNNNLIGVITAPNKDANAPRY
jgi:hypothetical protein